ncbi:hypothetical protein JCM10207_005107 [Rhodosporidiobolus poonsookiae]
MPALSPIHTLPPELLHHILSLAVEGLPAALRIRSTNLRSFALVASSWRAPAQALLESRVQIDSYGRARAFLDRMRMRQVERPLVLDELVLFFDFAPQEDDFYPLTEFMTRTLCETAAEIRFLHIRSVLLLNTFDTDLLRLPSFRALRNLKLDLPLEMPSDPAPLPLQLQHLSLSAMTDHSVPLLRCLLLNSSSTLTSLHLFLLKSGAPLHEHLLAAVPSLPSTLLHISLATHLVPLSESLLQFIAACSNLRTLTCTGVELEQLRCMCTSLSSPSLRRLEFTVPSPDPGAGIADVSALFDALLALPSLRNLCELRATRRIESAAKGAPAQLGQDARALSRSMRGREGRCVCVYEVTSRRPLP